MPFAPTKHPRLPRDVAAARKHFQSCGWSYRSAATVLGCTYQHLCQVLTGYRESKSLVARVLALPPRHCPP